MSGFANDLIAILEALNSAPAIVVAHSMSGLAAILAAAMAPALISRIITIGASACYRNIGAYKGGFEQKELDAIYAAMHSDYAGWASAFAPAALGEFAQPHDVMRFVQTCPACVRILQPLRFGSSCSVITGRNFRSFLCRST